MKNDKIEWVSEKTWKDFRETGLLLLMNQFLHIFGWAVVMEINDNKDVIRAYPARVKYRGFSEGSTANAHKKISDYMLKNAKTLKEESLM